MEGRSFAADYDVRPDILTFASTNAGHALAQAALASAGHLAGQRFDLAEAQARIEGGLRTDWFVLAADEHDGDALDALLDAIERGARTRRCGGIVLFAAADIDRITSRVSHTAIDLLCDATPAELAGGLTQLAVRNETVADLSRDETRKLRDLSAEVQRIATVLASLSRDGDGRVGRSTPPHAFIAEPVSASPAISADELRRILQARRLRARFFDPELFADPAWDILLDLLTARIEGKRVAVSSLCIAAAVPPTTALRWIRSMSDQGLLERYPDPKDGRRIFIGLSNSAAEAMHAYFAAARQSGLII